MTDAKSLVDLIAQIDEETELMLFEPKERNQTVEQQESFLKEIEHSPSKAMFVAEYEHKFIGFVVGIGGIANRNRHCCYIIIGVLKEYWGKGTAQQLLSNLESWAKDNKMHRLELTVMAHNQRAIALYEKFGFEGEGSKRDSMFVGGKFANEFYMSKLI